MSIAKIFEYIFFFGVLGLVGYMVWQIFAPFVAAIMLSAIIVVISYPAYAFLLRSFRGRATLAALVATLLVFITVVTPILLVSNILVNEFLAFYRALDVTNQTQIDQMLAGLESQLQVLIPNFDLNITEQIRQSIGWFTRNLGGIFAGTVSMIFTLLISIMGVFYLFKDGSRLLDWLTKISPLPDEDDRAILHKLGRSVRSVVTGVVFVSVVQGFAAAVGFSIFGIEQAILWGSLGALASLLPGIGSLGINVPGVIYLLVTGNVPAAIGLAVWSVGAIIFIDNTLGPYLMSRGNNLHPFVILLSVLGGIALFGPIGFIVGPVFISLFMVLLDLYCIHLSIPDTPNSVRSTN